MRHSSGFRGTMLLIATLAACSAERTLEPGDAGPRPPGPSQPAEPVGEGQSAPILCPAGTDCGMLAFVSDRSGNPDIYVVRVDGTEIKRLTDDPAIDSEPAWSPDGQRIAFVSNRFGRRDVFVMNADGSNVVRLTKPEDWPSTYVSSPTWSPDGKRIAFAGYNAISIVDAFSGRPITTSIGFTTGYLAFPSWSPDGRVAFVSDWNAYDFVYEVFVMNPDGSNISKLLAGSMTGSGAYYFEPAWSRDGERIAAVFCTWAWDNCYPDSRVVVANADGTGLRIVARTGGFSHPTWSPDGTMIAFSNQSCRGCPSSIRYVRTGDMAIGGPIVDDGHSPSWRP